MRHWRFATWNLDWWRKNERRRSPWELIAETRADVVALQEVRGGSEIREIRESHRGESVFSQEVYAEAKLSWMGCGLLFPPKTRIADQGVVDALPKPQRALWARVDLPGVAELTVVSWHSPNAAGDTRAVKMDAYKAMSEWLAKAPRPLALGADLNTWIDPVELARPAAKDPFFDEYAFMGIDPPHGLEDGFRRVLQQQGKLEDLQVSSPEGPLAVSHVLSSGAEHRMDRIFVSPELKAVDGDYVLDDARKAGSDHALHWLDLEGPA